jgi:hypothetical protein
MLECYSNTEIVVHDNNSQLASLMYYEGDTTNRIAIGRNMGWEAIRNLILNSSVTFNNSNTIFWYNSPGTYFTDSGFSSYFTVNSNFKWRGDSICKWRGNSS